MLQKVKNIPIYATAFEFTHSMPQWNIVVSNIQPHKHLSWYWEIK